MTLGLEEGRLEGVEREVVVVVEGGRVRKGLPLTTKCLRFVRTLRFNTSLRSDIKLSARLKETRVFLKFCEGDRSVWRERVESLLPLRRRALSLSGGLGSSLDWRDG